MKTEYSIVLGREAGDPLSGSSSCIWTNGFLRARSNPENRGRNDRCTYEHRLIVAHQSTLLHRWPSARSLPRLFPVIYHFQGRLLSYQPYGAQPSDLMTCRVRTSPFRLRTKVKKFTYMMQLWDRLVGRDRIEVVPKEVFHELIVLVDGRHFNLRGSQTYVLTDHRCCSATPRRESCRKISWERNLQVFSLLRH